MKSWITAFLLAIMLVVSIGISNSRAGEAPETYLEVLDRIRDNSLYYNSVEEALWDMLRDERLGMGFLQGQVPVSEMENQWPAIGEMREHLKHFILFSTVVEVTEVRNTNRFDPTLTERAWNLANRMYSIATSPVAGLAKEIIDISLSTFQRGVYESINQRFWTRYKEYQFALRREDILRALEEDGAGGLFNLMDTFWEQEEVVYAPQLRAFEDAYPQAVEAYRSQFLLQHLLAPPDPILTQWMRERRREAAEGIIGHFFELRNQWHSTRVTFHGTVRERFLPEHPVEGQVAFTINGLDPHTADVRKGRYSWTIGLGVLFDPVESSWNGVLLEFVHTVGECRDYRTAVEFTLPVLVAGSRLWLEEDGLQADIPPMEVVHFAEVRLDGDLDFELMGPRMAGNIPMSHPIRPYGRYRLVHGDAYKDVVLNAPKHRFRPPGTEDLPPKVEWSEPEVSGSEDPLEDWLEHKQEVLAAIMARTRLIRSRIRELEREFSETEAPALKDRIRALERERKEQEAVIEAVRGSTENFRADLRERRDVLAAEEREKLGNTTDILRLYGQMDRVFSGMGFQLRPFMQIGQQVLSWSGSYSLRMWDEESFEEQASEDAECLDEAYQDYREAWENVEDMNRELEEIESRGYDRERFEEQALQREEIIRVRRYWEQAQESNTRKQVEKAKDDLKESIDSFRRLTPELEALLAVLEESLEDLPPLPDNELAETMARRLEAKLKDMVETDTPRTDGRRMQELAARAVDEFAAYLPAELVGEETWCGTLSQTIQEIWYFRGDWGMHSETIRQRRVEGWQKLNERRLVALEGALRDVHVYLEYAGEHHNRVQKLRELLTLSAGHVEAMDDSRGYVQRMDDLMTAYEAVVRLPSLWREPGMEPILLTFVELLKDRDGLRVYARQNNLIYPVWESLSFPATEDEDPLELTGEVQLALSESYREDASRGLQAILRLEGEGWPLHLPLKIERANGSQMLLNSITMEPDGRVEAFLPNPPAPQMALQYLRVDLKRPHTFYRLLSKVPLLYWE